MADRFWHCGASPQVHHQAHAFEEPPAAVPHSTGFLAYRLLRELERAEQAKRICQLRFGNLPFAFCRGRCQDVRRPLPEPIANA